ncbi:hypothetical protein J3L16_01020 [Alteromonas sp. 5E99-2]|nr:hypothetical protein [Alteromonas sp. 5E99-2]
MTPTYSEGDYIVVAKWPFMKTLKGDAVVVNHPSYGVIVKRVREIIKPQSLLLQGDNPQSVSSEQMGLVDKHALIGKVIAVFKK